MLEIFIVAVVLLSGFMVSTGKIDPKPVVEGVMSDCDQAAILHVQKSHPGDVSGRSVSDRKISLRGR